MQPSLSFQTVFPVLQPQQLSDDFLLVSSQVLCPRAAWRPERLREVRSQAGLTACTCCWLTLATVLVSMCPGGLGETGHRAGPLIVAVQTSVLSSPLGDLLTRQVFTVLGAEPTAVVCAVGPAQTPGARLLLSWKLQFPLLCRLPQTFTQPGWQIPGIRAEFMKLLRPLQALDGSCIRLCTAKFSFFNFCFFPFKQKGNKFTC